MVDYLSHPRRLFFGLFKHWRSWRGTQRTMETKIYKAVRFCPIVTWCNGHVPKLHLPMFLFLFHSTHYLYFPNWNDLFVISKTPPYLLFEVLCIIWHCMQFPSSLLSFTFMSELLSLRQSSLLYLIYVQHICILNKWERMSLALFSEQGWAQRVKSCILPKPPAVAVVSISSLLM